MIITLDGPSGTGKSTLSKLLADELGFKLLNTGMIYRAITYYFVANNIDCNDSDSVNNALNTINIDLKFNRNQQSVFINSEDMTPFINTKTVQKNVSIVSQIYQVRKLIYDIQHKFAENNDMVIEGRDIGTAIFPDAEIKFYVTCDTLVRAKRRLDDLNKSSQNFSLQEVYDSLENRDLLDKSREFGPLKRPDDAIDIDTTNSTVEQSLSELLSYIKK